MSSNNKIFFLFRHREWRRLAKKFQRKRRRRALATVEINEKQREKETASGNLSPETN